MEHGQPHERIQYAPGHYPLGLLEGLTTYTPTISPTTGLVENTSHLTLSTAIPPDALERELEAWTSQEARHSLHADLGAHPHQPSPASHNAHLSHALSSFFPSSFSSVPPPPPSDSGFGGSAGTDHHLHHHLFTHPASAGFQVGSFPDHHGVPPALLSISAPTPVLAGGPLSSSPPGVSEEREKPRVPTKAEDGSTAEPASKRRASSSVKRKPSVAAKKESPPAAAANDCALDGLGGSSAYGDGGDSDETSRDKADDKRRRNTQASARFRARKKEKEIALEASKRGLQGRVDELEKEVEMLKTENGWLRGLILEGTQRRRKSNGGGGGKKRTRREMEEPAGRDDDEEESDASSD